MTLIRRHALLVAAALGLAFAAAACGGGSGSSSPAGSGTDGGTVNVASTDLGDVLVDAQGLTLYLFEADTGGTSTCTGSCADEWPPVTSARAPTAGPGVDGGKLGTVERPDGTAQVTYADHPLYRFSGDTSPGDVNGEASDAFGAEWYAVSSNGRAVKQKTGGSYGGY
jgi:predicted lipoprotein with Yx(FWY)xxD motif